MYWDWDGTDDAYDDEDLSDYDIYRRKVSDLYPNLDTGAVNPGKIYPVEHGVDCQGHDTWGDCYSEVYKWTYVRTPPPPFQHESNVAWPKEEYL